MSDLHPLEIVHAVPGRVRLRAVTLRDDPAQARDVEALARELPGFESVAVRPQTSSVIVRYSLEDTDPASFHAALASRFDLREPRKTAPPAPTAPDTPAAPRPVPRPLGAQLTRQVRRLWVFGNRKTLSATGGLLDLHSSVPWVLLFLGIRQVVISSSLGPLPWYTAFYYALQAVMRYPDLEEAERAGDEATEELVEAVRS